MEIFTPRPITRPAILSRERKPVIIEAKPEIITMCGSTRFSDLMAALSWEFEKQGKIVLRVNYIPDWYVKKDGWKENSHGAEQSNLKKELDDLHFRKIDLCDSVFVCNFKGYIGDSTSNEIRYALMNNKRLNYLIGLFGDMYFDEDIRKCTQWYADEFINEVSL